jgi:hypothetical protein
MVAVPSQEILKTDKILTYVIIYSIINLQLEQKQKYAAWKAADIRKAIKEGRRPEPGPPGGENDMTFPSDSSSSSVVIP